MIYPRSFSKFLVIVVRPASLTLPTSTCPLTEKYFGGEKLCNLQDAPKVPAEEHTPTPGGVR